MTVLNKMLLNCQYHEAGDFPKVKFLILVIWFSQVLLAIHIF